MADRKVNSCPICGVEPIHARAVDYPLLDPENNFGYSLSVECSVHGWQSKGDGWTRDELIAAGLKAGG